MATRTAPALTRTAPVPNRSILEVLAERARPHVLAGEDLVPLHAAFGAVAGAAGLTRGATVVISSAGAPGSLALALGLIADATAAGLWCAAVDLPALGLVAAAELGVELDRLALVPSSHPRPARVIAALLGGCDVVIAAEQRRLSAGEARRLMARARERRSVLVVTTDRPGGASAWPEPPDLSLEVVASRFSGIDDDAGRLTGHLVEVVATRRRATTRTVRAQLWLPGPDGRIDAELAESDHVRQIAAGGS